MRTYCVKKGLVIGIIVLFIGACVIPGISGNIGNNSNIEKASHLRSKDLRSALMERMNTYRSKDFRLNQFENILPIYDGSHRGWSITEVVSTESTETSNLPSIAYDSNGDIHVIWTDKTNYAGSGSDWDIFYKMKPSGGSWTTTEVVTSESDANSLSYSKSLNIDSNGDIHVVWEEESDTDYYVFYKMKPSGGSWTSAEMVSSEVDNYPEPSSAVESDGTVHVVWSERSGGVGDIFYRNKPSDGSWSVAEKVPLEDSVYPSMPTLAVDSDGTVHLAWADNSSYGGSGSDWDIFYKMKPSGGSWSAMEVVSTEGSDESIFPDLEVDSNRDVYIIFFEIGMDEKSYIKYKSKPSGGSWTSVEVVSLYGYAFISDLAVESDGTAHVAWEEIKIDEGIMFDIFYRMKPSDGSWADAELVSTEGGEYTDSINPNIEVDSDGIVHVAWADNYDYTGSGEDGDIFYKNKVSENQAPNAPTITGPTSGKVGTNYDYTFIAVDPEGHDVYYYIDWGDNTFEEWLGPCSSGAVVTIDHAWEKQGTYKIRAKAKDIFDAESDWSTLEVMMPKNKPFNYFNLNPIGWLFERFPNAFPTLRHLLGLT